MFRALICPSSGGKIVLSQHLVSSLSVNGCTIHRLFTHQPLETLLRVSARHVCHHHGVLSVFNLAPSNGLSKSKWIKSQPHIWTRIEIFTRTQGTYNIKNGIFTYEIFYWRRSIQQRWILNKCLRNSTGIYRKGRYVNQLNSFK